MGSALLLSPNSILIRSLPKRKRKLSKQENHTTSVASYLAWRLRSQAHNKATQQRSHTQKTGEDLYIRPKSHTSTHLLAWKLLTPLYGNRHSTARSRFGYRSSFAI